jgi:hypothetical protein
MLHSTGRDDIRFPETPEEHFMTLRDYMLSTEAFRPCGYGQ